MQIIILQRFPQLNRILANACSFSATEKFAANEIILNQQSKRVEQTVLEHKQKDTIRLYIPLIQKLLFIIFTVITRLRTSARMPILFL